MDWLKVARLESKALFLLQMQDGSYSGRILAPDTLPGVPVKLEIQPANSEPLVIDRSNVVCATQFSDRVLSKFSGKNHPGLLSCQRNHTMQYNFGSQLGYQETRWAATLGYSSNLSSSSGTAVSTHNQVDLSGYRLLSWKQYFYFGTATFLQSSAYRRFQRQTVPGIGVGRFLKNSNRLRLSVEGRPRLE